MFCTVLSAAVRGMGVDLISVQVDISNGLPVFQMVGYLSGEVKEAGERVRAALRNSGITIPPKRITVNLAPGDIRKHGTAFDLPVAAAVLGALQIIDSPLLDGILMMGELSLNGDINPVAGILPALLRARELGCTRCIVPWKNRKEGAVVEGMEVIGVSSIKEVAAYFGGEKEIKGEYLDIGEQLNQGEKNYGIDFSDIRGQEGMKRAAMVAAAGSHHLLMIGPPGAGKTMIAKRIPTILPNLSKAECLEISKVYSIMGALSEEEPVITRRPFRDPHHSVTSSALVGGGKIPRPGEISLAAHGVLLLHELPEFQGAVLEQLREPLEEKMIRINRNMGSYTFPANFFLVADMNPCKCGYYPDMNRCTCTHYMLQHYLSKLSGALLDRIDICAEAEQMDYEMLVSLPPGESSDTIRKKVTKARELQIKRYQKESFSCNSELDVKGVEKYCRLTAGADHYMEEIFQKLRISIRVFHKILKVARTIADLEDSPEIEAPHISEAVSYRAADQKYWRKGACKNE